MTPESIPQSDLKITILYVKRELLNAYLEDCNTVSALFNFN